LDLQKQKKEEELNFSAKEEGAKKLQGQLFQLKTNKDYQAMLHQIADTKADGSVIEDKILQIMENMDKVKADIEIEKQALVKEEKIFNDEKSKIQSSIKEIDDNLKQLDSQKKQVMPGIEQSIYAQYERILQSRDGLAIVTVKNNSCLGCHMSVPHQVVNLVKMYENIVTCDMCNRILYINEDVE
jgi:predicted  nucleic acid-binding Zn-ribbon protein